MIKPFTSLSMALLAATLAACSDSNSNASRDASIDDAPVLSDGALDDVPVTSVDADADSQDDAPVLSDGALDDVPVTSVDADADSQSPIADGSTENDVNGETDNTDDALLGEPFPLIPADRPPTPDLAELQVPTLDENASVIASPDSEDPFGHDLEIDNEVAVAGGPPTQPKNLRVELVSNNWAELNWAPSNDDGEVVQYNIYRSDGVTYSINGTDTDPSDGSQIEIDKYWKTTSFIDCNFTRFDERLHACGDGRQPLPGSTYEYEVTAVDNMGNESIASESVSVTYLKEKNAPVPRYNDFYLGESDTFAQDHDLSAVDYFLDDNFQLVFQDEFTGDSLDLQKWQTRLTWGDEKFINLEQQYFVNVQDDPDFGYDPFKFTGDSMIIEAMPITDEMRLNLPAICNELEEPAGLNSPGYDPCEFVSGAISTFDRFRFLYGYVEGRFKVSGAPGAISTFYIYHRYQGTGKEFHAPEIDILEYLGENPFGEELAFQTYHYESPLPDGDAIFRSVPTMGAASPDGIPYGESDEWHTFSVLWEPQLVIWYIDGIEIKRMFGPQVSRRPMNVINYLVAGSAWAPTPDITNEALFPMQFELDYVRVYQRDAYVSNAHYGPD